MKKIYFIFFLFNLSNSNNVILISVPKSGTWLLVKYVQKLTRRKNANHTLLSMNLLKNYEYDDLNGSSTPLPKDAVHFFKPNLNLFSFYIDFAHYNQYFVSHLIYSKEYENFLLKNNFKAIFLIRDPRDLLVSRANYILKNKDKFPALQKLNFDDLLLKLIGAKDFCFTRQHDLYSSHICYPNEPIKNDISHIGYFYANYLPWLNCPACITVRFEDLVGSRGLGDDQVQLKTLKYIAHYLEGQANEQRINKIIPKLFGGTTTFNKGQIGAWRKCFKPEHKLAFKKVGNKLLIALGYENSENW